MKNKRHTLTGSMPTLLAAASALFLAACGQPSSEAPATEAKASGAIDNIQILDTKPSDALAVKAAREQLKPGDEAIVFGQIGGVEQPFLEGYAGFVLGDTEIMFCNEMGDDHCPTPWDACCEDADKLKVSRASVQFVDAEGQILPGNVKGFAGLEGLSHVVVKGKVAAGSNPGNLIIEARSLYAEKK